MLGEPMGQVATKRVLNPSLLKVLGQSFHIEAAADPLVGKLVNDQGNRDAENKTVLILHRNLGLYERPEETPGIILAVSEAGAESARSWLGSTEIVLFISFIPLLSVKPKDFRSYRPMDKDPFDFDYVNQPH